MAFEKPRVKTEVKNLKKVVHRPNKLREHELFLLRNSSDSDLWLTYSNDGLAADLDWTIKLMPAHWVALELFWDELKTILHPHNYE